MFHKLIKAEIEKVVPNIYHEYDFQIPPDFPYAVYTVRYHADTDDGKYMGTLEVELVDNYGDNKEPMETLTFSLIRALHHKTLQNDEWYVSLYMNPSGGFTIPALDDRINRKMLQFTLNIDRRFM